MILNCLLELWYRWSLINVEEQEILNKICDLFERGIINFQEFHRMEDLLYKIIETNKDKKLHQSDQITWSDYVVLGKLTNTKNR